MQNSILFLIATLLVLALGCSSAPPQEVSPAALDGGMRGLAAQDSAFWNDWTERPPAPMEIDDRLRPATVFDAWRVEDPAFQQPMWDALFHILNALDVRIDDDSRGLKSLMLRLDPHHEKSRWEMSFVSHEEARYEGAVLRIATEDGAGLWLEASRTVGSSPMPTRWILRAEPAAEEADGVTVWWNRDDDRWNADVAGGAGATDDETPLDADWEKLIGLFEAAFWEPITNRDYMEPDYTRVEAVADKLGAGWPPALGATMEERQLRDFAQDTVFPPRTTGGLSERSETE